MRETVKPGIIGLALGLICMAAAPTDAKAVEAVSSDELDSFPDSVVGDVVPAGGLSSPFLPLSMLNLNLISIELSNLNSNLNSNKNSNKSSNENSNTTKVVDSKVDVDVKKFDDGKKKRADRKFDRDRKKFDDGKKKMADSKFDRDRKKFDDGKKKRADSKFDRDRKKFDDGKKKVADKKFDDGMRKFDKKRKFVPFGQFVRKTAPHGPPDPKPFGQFVRKTAPHGPPFKRKHFDNGRHHGGDHVNAAPEPATWIMMIAGFWIAAWRLRRVNGGVTRPVPA